MPGVPFSFRNSASFAVASPMSPSPHRGVPSLNLYMVDTMDEVLKIALAEPVRPTLPAQATPVQPSPPDDQTTH